MGYWGRFLKRVYCRVWVRMQMLISQWFAVYCFFSKKGLTFKMLGVVCAPLFGGVDISAARHWKTFLNFFQKGVDAKIFSRMFPRPPSGGALPISGRESETLFFFWVYWIWALWPDVLWKLNCTISKSPLRFRLFCSAEPEDSNLANSNSDLFELEQNFS